jgi:SAM-dependent methyltransferase
MAPRGGPALAEDSRQLETHFAFGENWQSFVATVTEENVAEAVRGMERLFPGDEMKGRRFVDIGCGSGLSMLAALRLGASSALGIDIDPSSAAAARALLTRYMPDGPWAVRMASILELAAEQEGAFDIVYSWGVLHHSGDMAAALRKAAALVAPGGSLALALYRKTPLCGFWRREKRFYKAAGKPARAAIRLAYQAVFNAGLLASGRNPLRYRRDYKSARGMDWAHDVHDWLGGYPYESVAPGEVARLLEGLGFTMTRIFAKPAALGGLLGSHCDEFVARRRG